LQEASAALRDYRERNSTIDLSGETTDLIGRVGQLEGQKTGVLAELAGSQAQLRAVQAQLRDLPVNSQTASSIVRRPEVASLRAQLSELRLKRIEESRVYKSNNRVIQDIDKQIADVTAQLQREPQSEVGAWQPNPLRQKLVEDASQLQGQILAAQARLRGQDLAIANARGQLKQLPGRAYDLSQLVTDEAAQREGYELLARKYQDLRIQEEQRVANARILERARPSASPVSPRRNFNLGVSFFLGSILACALALLLDRRDDRIHGDDDVVSTSRLPILAHIPAIDSKSQPIFAATSRKTSPLLEAFRMLRINLAFANLDESLRSLVITSSQPGEGKSTSAVNLATVMAMSGSRVILVDCDLRRPNLHSLFGLPNTNGLTSVVAGMAPLGEALQTTSVTNLRVLTSGPVPPNPSELLDSRGGRGVLQSVLSEADFVIFDCPPALLLSDAQIVATVADAVLLVVGYAQASKRDVARTSALLTRGGAKMLGVLFNKVDMGPDGAYGRYQSYAPYFDSNSNPSALTTSTPALVANGSHADEAGDGSNLPPSR
jgi:capsular exopolysaccharide synthesis family protein